MSDIKNRRGKLLDSQDEVGGWPELKSKPAPKDLDRDGMADAWEVANNLDQRTQRTETATLTTTAIRTWKNTSLGTGKK